MDQVLLVKRHVLVFFVPTTSSIVGSFRASQWKLDKPDKICRLRILLRRHQDNDDDFINIQLEDDLSGELFANCFVDRFPTPCIEPVTDSSRYFVLTIVSPDRRRKALLGIGFTDRGDAFDFNITLQEFFKSKQRCNDIEAKANTADIGGKLENMQLKEGEKIRINLMKREPAKSEKRSKYSGNEIEILPAEEGSSIPRLAPPPNVAKK